MTNISLSFDGVDDFVEVTDNSSLNGTNISIGTWFSIEDLDYPGNSEGQVLVSKWGDDSEGYNNQRSYRVYYEKVDSQPKISFIISSDGSVQENNYVITTSSKSIEVQNWHMTIGTYDGDSLKLYLDGTLVGSTNFSKGIYYGDQNPPIRFGRKSDHDGMYLNGNLDEVAIWDTALTADEVSTLYGSL